MKGLRQGSVLMEMIVVFPIYLVLFGGLFMLGDMLIKAARLPSAERTTAFDLGRMSASEEGWEAVREFLFANSDTDDLHKEKVSEYYADTNKEGPFSLRVATTVRNDYKIPGGATLGQLKFADWFLKKATTGDAESAAGDETETASDEVSEVAAESGFMADLINNDKAVAMRSKDFSQERTYTYNYYCLRRRRYREGDPGDSDNPGEGEGWTWRSNARPAADLMVDNGGTQHWLDVAGENWHGSVGNESGNRDKLKGLNGTRNFGADYSRYPQFVTWSD